MDELDDIMEKIEAELAAAAEKPRDKKIFEGIGVLGRYGFTLTDYSEHGAEDDIVYVQNGEESYVEFHISGRERPFYVWAATSFPRTGMTLDDMLMASHEIMYAVHAIRDLDKLGLYGYREEEKTSKEEDGIDHSPNSYQ